jgi:tetratricopeptide (TPR) repeat protein
MNSPHLEAFGDRELLGSGPNGAVFRAVKADGTVSAVKLLDGMAVNRGLLEKACAKLERGGWPQGVLEVLEADFRARPAARVTPCLADPTEDGHWRPRSLQYQLDEFPGDRSWGVVLGVIDAMAALHDRQVAHANLKPGNVFFDDDQRVVLSDWALGNMPGVGHHEFTDACLYQPPEQLRSADGYLEEEGYRWDVFSIGVLAYRILTGSFPRCDSTFQQVAPPSGEITREGIAADLPKIAKSLEGQSSIEWPDEPANELELRYREILDRCLALDPLARPANAMEVRRLIRRAEVAVEEEEKRDAVLDQHRRAQRASWRSSIAAGILFAGLVTMVFLWQLAQSQYEHEVSSRRTDVAELEKRLDEAVVLRDEAIQAEEEARTALNTERTTWLARVEESRQIGDRLFAWAMEKGHRSLPPLDGREVRLNRLEKYYERFLERTAQVPELDDERARARLQLAEIALAKGDPVEAARRFEVAVESAELLEGGADLDLRLATDRLILALLLQERNDPKTGDAFLAARQSLEQVPQSEVDGDRMAYLLATLDLNESRYLAVAGNEGDALELLHRATEKLNQLADSRPDVAILRSELVACYLSSAGILDGMGEMGDARVLRNMAAEELLIMIKERPTDLNLRLELAGCYGAIAETALLAGDVVQAESMSNGAVKLLVDILPQRPDSVIARSRLAAQRGLMAGILRDRGEGEKALELYDEGLRLLEGLTVGEMADPMARYRYALLTWEKGRMQGFGGDRESEIAGEQKAVEMLKELLETPYGIARGEQIRRSLGYLLGDLGHAAQLAGKDDLSSSAFTEAVKTWENLNRERPGSEEYEEALAWNRQRLDDVR